MNFGIDFSELEQNITRPKFYKYADVKHRLVKVAFDIVRFRDSEDIDGLWQIQETDDGEVIVATYEEPEVKTASTNYWQAKEDASGKTVVVFYKDEPVKKIALDQVGIPSSESHLMCDYLPKKLGSDHSFKTKLIKELPSQYRQELLSKFPELND